MKQYDHDSIQELLNWAQSVLDNKSYPKGEIQVSRCAKVVDCKKYLETMVSMISKNAGNPTFFPAISQLREFRIKLEEPDE